MATVTDIAEAVKDYINGESYSESFTATRTNQIKRELEKADQLEVTIYAGPVEYIRETKIGHLKNIIVYLVFQEKINAVTETDLDARIDALLTLREEVEDSLAIVRGGGFSGHTLDTIGTEGGDLSAFDPDAMEQHTEFRSVRSLLFVDAITP